MVMTTEKPFVFEDWKALAENDPSAFEEARENLLKDVIAQAPQGCRQRLGSLQWRIDKERERSANPMSACVRISEMMLNAVYGKSGLVEALSGEISPAVEEGDARNVIPFRPRQ